MNEHEWKPRKCVENGKAKLMKMKCASLFFLNAQNSTHQQHTKNIRLLFAKHRVYALFPFSAKFVSMLCLHCRQSFSSSHSMSLCLVCKVVVVVVFTFFLVRSAFALVVPCRLYAYIIWADLLCAISKSNFAFCWHTLKMYTILHSTAHIHTAFHLENEKKIDMRLCCSISLVDGEHFDFWWWIRRRTMKNVMWIDREIATR